MLALGEMEEERAKNNLCLMTAGTEAQYLKTLGNCGAA